MLSLSVQQPFATLIASGEKSIETRTWPTKHRGDLLICAAMKLHKSYSHELTRIYPVGVAICIVELYDCRPMTRDDEPAARCAVYPRAWSWLLRNVRTVEPFRVQGRLGLFHVSDDRIRIRQPVRSDVGASDTGSPDH
jgi:hypothetical protein